MSDESSLRLATLTLRVTLGVFLLQWGIEKFLIPGNTPAIWGYFYGVDVPQALAYVFGLAELTIAACLFLGLFKTLSYGSATALHAVSVVVSWRQLINPWGDSANHLFIAGVPVLGAFIALFLLRRFDRGVFDAD
jgi:putative oxidoreductase